MKNIILASASPRRKELLSKTALPFEIVVSDCDENIDIKEPDNLVIELSGLKARDVAGKCPGSIVIGADTVVSHKGTIMGKPKTKEDAVDMIKSFAGDNHQVYTGICIIVPEACISCEDVEREKIKCSSFDDDKTPEEIFVLKKKRIEKNLTGLVEKLSILYDDCENMTINYCVRTNVNVVEMTEEEIKNYVDTGEPMDKAGAYAIQGLFAPYISSIEGDYYNVVGLPVCSLNICLKNVLGSRQILG